MNTLRKELEKSIKLITIIPKTVKHFEHEFLNVSITWPPKAY